ncbi:MAG: hypothetical protein AM1032_000393 [Mycoplasmataceae bacterium]|nr:MAG: hypothetical protein AM1032_000393 [Mycoplasmataceae bacterium]
MLCTKKFLDKWYPRDNESVDKEEKHFHLVLRKNVINLGNRRNELTTLNISGWNSEINSDRLNWSKLTGILDISDFINLKRLDCSSNKLTDLVISNNNKLEVLFCSNNLLTNINTEILYNLTQLYCEVNSINLLNLENNHELIELVCYENQISDLNFSNNLKLELISVLENKLKKIVLINLNKLKYLYCTSNLISDVRLEGLVELRDVYLANNLLTKFNFNTLNRNSLLELCLHNNDLRDTDISEFSVFINLELLSIGNSNEEKIKLRIYNRFYGSLSSIKCLSKLKDLSIINTEVEEDFDLKSLYSDDDNEKVSLIYNKVVKEELKENLKSERECFEIALDNSEKWHNLKIENLKREKDEIIFKLNEMIFKMKYNLVDSENENIEINANSHLINNSFD